MSKAEYYRLCLKEGNFKEAPTFKIRFGKLDKTINTYYIPSDKQRYNYDILLEKDKENEILIEVLMNEKMVGKGMLKFDAKRSDMQNEKVDIMDLDDKIGQIECSLTKIEKQQKKPEMKIRVIQASYTEDLDNVGKMDPFVVIKYGDNNYKTEVIEGGGKTPVWKEEFNIGTADNDRIFIESWEEDLNGSEFIGVSIVDVSKIGKGEIDIDVIKETEKLKEKQGVIKIELLQKEKASDNEKEVNDKNMIKKRNIKTYAVEAVMKENTKKGSFIKLQSGDQDFETTPIFTENKELKWNQSFQIKCIPGDELIAKLCIKEEIEEEIARCSIKINEITNKKYVLSLSDGKKEIGKLYLEFFDEELVIKEEIPKEELKAEPKPVVAEKQSVSPETQAKLSKSESEIKAIKQRYSSRQSIHDYMAEVNSALQEGLLNVAKDRPEDPIKQLGLFLINYKK